MPERPSDFNVHIKKLEETLLSCFEQWKEVTAALNRCLEKSESAKMGDFNDEDLIILAEHLFEEVP